jgi:hypothetical protein
LILFYSFQKEKKRMFNDFLCFLDLVGWLIGPQLAGGRFLFLFSPPAKAADRSNAEKPRPGRQTHTDQLPGVEWTEAAFFVPLGLRPPTPAEREEEFASAFFNSAGRS